MADGSYRDCFAAAIKAAGRELSEDELHDLFTAAQNRIDRLVREGMSPRDAATEAARQLGHEWNLSAIVERRNKVINLRIRRGLVAAVGEGEEAQRVRAILTGVEGNKRGLADSVDARMNQSEVAIISPLEADLKQAGVLDALLDRSHDFDRDIGRELWRLEDQAAGKPTGNEAAAKIAKILHTYQEKIRLRLNKAGAWIGKQAHYVTRQSHDMWKIAAATAEEWVSFIRPLLDERTFDGVEGDRDAWLREIYNALRTGIHENTTGASGPAGPKGAGVMAKRLSQGRVLHFKDADSWMTYNERFGRGHIADSIFRGLMHGARNAALMEQFGTNPEAMYRDWMDRLIARANKRGDAETVKRLQGQWNDRIFDTITGKANQPADVTLGKIGSMARLVNQVRMLGFVLFSSIGDLGVNSAMLRHNGVPVLERYEGMVRGLLPTASKERAYAATMLGAAHDSLLGDVISRFRSEDDRLGRMSAQVSRFHRWTGLTYWTDAMRRSCALMLSHNLARQAAKAFGNLPQRLQITLRRYGIEEAEWRALRKAKMFAADGRHYILPAHLTDLSDEAVAHLGGEPEAMKVDLQRKLQTYIIDQVREGMTEGTAGTRTMANWGTQSGTVAGEMVRLMMQFKSYAFTYMSRTMKRELMRMGPGNETGDFRGFRRAVMAGADVPGLAWLIATTTALGYVSMSLKDLAKGRDPRVPETKSDFAKVVAASAVQGGGAGIFGDFLFGEANRFGGGPLTTLAGPTAGVLSDAVLLYQSIKDGYIHYGFTHKANQEAGSALLRFGINDVPWPAAIPQAALLNTFYAKSAMEYLVYYRLQEMMNPGYLRRYENRVRQENSQGFWLSPSWSPYRAAGLTQ